jgi:hypothetical protein
VLVCLERGPAGGGRPGSLGRGLELLAGRLGGGLQLGDSLGVALGEGGGGGSGCDRGLLLAVLLLLINHLQDVGED